MSKWNEINIGKLVSFSKGRLTEQSDNFEDGYMPLINADAVNGNPTLFSNTKGAVLCEENDILMLWDGERSGLVTIGHKGVVGSTFSKLQTIETIDSKFLFYFLNDKFSWIQNNRTGTGVPHVPKDLGKILFVRFPEKKSEQQKIAKVLSTTESVIEKTQAALSKYKAIKQGILNDLFTRGIDIKTGKLRPKQEDAPKLYKNSDLGWIPNDWEIVKLGVIGEFKNGVNKDKFSFGHGTLFVNIGDAYHEILDCSTLNRVSVSDLEKQQYSLTNGDIIFVRSSVKPDGVGYNTMFLQFNDDVVFCGFMIRFRLDDKIEFNPEFYNSYFRHIEFRKRLLCVSTVSANTNVNQVALSGLSAIKPNEKEQLAITMRLNTINKQIQTEQTYLHKLQQIKSGLMTDLLSGKKLVTVTTELETQTT